MRSLGKIDFLNVSSHKETKMAQKKEVVYLRSKTKTVKADSITIEVVQDAVDEINAATSAGIAAANDTKTPLTPAVLRLIMKPAYERFAKLYALLFDTKLTISKVYALGAAISPTTGAYSIFFTVIQADGAHQPYKLVIRPLHGTTHLAHALAVTKKHNPKYGTI